MIAKTNMANNNKPEPKPGHEPPPVIPAARTPRNSTELTQLINTLRLQRDAFQSQLDVISKAVFTLAPSYTLNEPEAVAQMEELQQREAKTQQHIKLCDLSLQQSLQLLKIMTERETEESERQRKRSFEGCLLAALDEAKQADSALKQYASAMRARDAHLEQAQLYANLPHELGTLRQLGSQQGPTWAFGHFGLGKYLEEASLMHRTNYQTLTDYSTPRLANYGLNDDTDQKEQQPGSHLDTPPPSVATERSPKAGKAGRPN